MRAPASGGPVKLDTLTTVKAIPILTPDFFRSFSRLILPITAGQSACITALPLPYMTANTYKVAMDLIPIHANIMTPQMKAKGIRTLRPPILSA